MEVKIAKSSGFCMGVQTAIDKVMECSRNEKGEVYVLGEIIHNPLVIKNIADRGIKTIENIDEINSGTLVIRSHGAGEETFLKAKEKGLKVVDATCIFVKKIHEKVREYYNKGYQIVIIGEKTHAEVIGTNGWCYNSAIIINDENEKINLENYEKVAIVVQTTYSKDKFNKIIKNIVKDSRKTVEIFETICYTTRERQKEAKELSDECEAMVVIGGLNSSNTNKLYEICRESCKNVFRVSDSKSVDFETLKKYNKIGIVAGASTPKEQSKEVFLKMANIEEEIKAEGQNEMQEAVDKMSAPVQFRKGQKIVAVISSATDEGLTLYISNTKKDILLSKDELMDETYDKANYESKIGEEIEVLVMDKNPLKVSEKMIKKIKEEEAALEELKNGKIFTVTVDGSNKGGLTARFGSYLVFIPSSQIRMGFVKELDKYVGKTLRLQVLKIEDGDKRKQIVASQRVILEAERVERDAQREVKENAFFDSINLDDIVNGKVVRIADFGAFVDVNGFDCLAHISDLAWTGVNTPADVLEIGKNYDFKVLKIDRENKKVSIGYKQLQPKPWDLVADKYPIDSVITGKVVRIVSFGAFIEVEKGIDGLVHVSQISHDWLENPTSALAIGQEIEAKVLDIDPEKEKLTLSIKALLPEPEVRKTNPNKPQRREQENTTNSGNNSNANEERPRRSFNRDRKPSEEEGMREWNEGGLGGASIGEMLNNLNK